MKKEEVCNRDRAKPAASPTDYWGSKPTYSPKKKKKKKKPQYRAISKSLNQKSNQQTKPQYRAEQTPNPNTEQTKPQTQYRANQTPLQSKPNPQSCRSQLARLRRRSSQIAPHRRSLDARYSLPHCRSPLITNRKSQSCFDAWCSVLVLPPSRYFSLSFSLWLFLSQSLSLSLSLSKFEMKTTKWKMPLRVSLFIL